MEKSTKILPTFVFKFFKLKSFNELVTSKFVHPFIKE